MGEPASTGGHSARVFFMTLGCPKNEVDTDRMRALVDGSIHEISGDFDTADVVVLNTCGFIEDAVSESVDNALDLIRWRDAAPDRRLVVAGCMVSRYGDDLAAELPEPDAFLSVAEEERIVPVLDRLFSAGPVARPGPAHEPRRPVLRTRGRHSAYLQVSDGCFRDCSFCTIPSIRGPYRSRPLEALVEEARYLVAGGARELVMIGQDITAWGRDIEGGQRLSELVHALSAIDDLRWLRLMYVQPDGIGDDLLEAMAAHDTVVEYLDMPLQHVSKPLLRRMNRSGSVEEFSDLITRVRHALPGIAIRTTFIAGFPGEAESDLDELLTFIGSARLDYVGVFPYSPEEGTSAASLDSPIDPEERLVRAQRLRDAADAVSRELLESRLGSVESVMSDGVDEEGAPVGRLRVQAPEVDGLVYLDRHVEAGTICDTRLVDSLGYDLEGEVVTC
jgi:ribosomal protein S12 methylthiotransferase